MIRLCTARRSSTMRLAMMAATIAAAPSPAKWIVANGMATVNEPSGDIETKRSFGNYQLHIEWRIPAGPAPIILQPHGDKSAPINFGTVWVRVL